MTMISTQSRPRRLSCGRWGILVFLLLSSTFARGAELAPQEYRYQWRQPEGRIQILWVGGGHWHDTLETAAILRRVLEGGGRYHVTYTEDLSALTRLEQYDVVLLNGMFEALKPEEERGLLGAVRDGKPLLVLHAASAAFRKPPPAKKNDPVAEHPEYYKMLGGYVEKHPPLGPVRVRVVAPEDPIVKGIGEFETEDELFLFRNLEPDNKVLLETEYEGLRRPLAWTRAWGKGRVLHVALGHGAKTAAHPDFQRLLTQGLEWLTEKKVMNSQ